ncbi:MAG TPA: hypothetical protein VNF69_15340 [Burkholderiales bacterium]|nr:hypothetical protein [Burkholderiales bacterium]
MIWLRRLVAFAVILSVWQGVASLRIVPAQYLPSVGRTAVAFVKLWTTRDTLVAEALTVGRTLAGLAVTIPLGVGRFPG